MMSTKGTKNTKGTKRTIETVFSCKRYFQFFVTWCLRGHFFDRLNND